MPNHIPLSCLAEQGAHACCKAIVARANPLVQQIPPTARPVLVIFQGPHGYILAQSGTRQQTTKRTPSATWELSR